MPDPIQLNQVGKKLKQEIAQPASGEVVTKTKDPNPPQTPSVTRAFCFDHITDPSTHVHPNPPPTPPAIPTPRRDPFLLELGNIELGSKIQIISLSDDPNASFDKGNVFELNFTGYDANTRQGTVLLSAEEMEKKAIQPGERLVVRVLDDNGNASDGVYVHVDPQRWAGNQRIDTKDANGNQVTLTGAQISFTDGFVKPGEDASTKTKSTWGAVLNDTSAPELRSDNLEVRTLNWTKAEAEMFQSIGQHGQFFEQSTAEGGAAWCATPGNLDTIPIEYRSTVAAMGANGGELLFKMLQSQFPDKKWDDLKKIPLTQSMFQQMANTANGAVANGGTETIVVMKNALEPGCRTTVTNNSTGEALNGAQNDQQRSQIVRLHMRDGDKITVQYSDGNGVRGKEAYAFEYSSQSKNGKTKESGGFKNPLNMQLAARTVKLNGE